MQNFLEVCPVQRCGIGGAESNSRAWSGTGIQMVRRCAVRNR